MNLGQDCQSLSNFSQNPQESQIQHVIKVLADLCRQKAIVQAEFQGFIKCCICRTRKGQRVKLRCQHVLHPACLEQKARILSKETFDPDLLFQLECGDCKTLIVQNEYTEIVGKKKIEQYQEKVNLELQQRIEREQKEQRQTQIANRRFDCDLCLEPTLISEGITMSCSHNHRFCKQCTTEMIKTQIKQGKYQSNAIVCRAEDCNEPLDQQLIKFCIGPEEYSKFASIQHKNLKVEGLEFRQCGGYTYKDMTYLVDFQDKMEKKEYIKAQEELERKCKAIDSGQREGANLKGDILKCQAITSYDPKQNNHGGFLKCHQCMLESCIKGCDSAHRGNTCQKYKQWQAINGQSKSISLEQIKALGMAQCQNPTCMRIILKNQGCDHVTCVCGFQICYRCSKPYTVCKAACPRR